MKPALRSVLGLCCFFSSNIMGWSETSYWKRKELQEKIEAERWIKHEFTWTVGRARDSNDPDFEKKGKKFGEKWKECKRMIFKVWFFWSYWNTVHSYRTEQEEH